MLFRFVSGVFSACVLSFSSLVFAEKLVLTMASAAGEEKGVVTIELNAEKAPLHVERIKRLANEGLYNGVVFHRVIPGFMAQTGDVAFGNMKNLNMNSVGTGGSSYDDLQAEFSNVPFVEGVVGMARSRYVHSANSQFFIMTNAHSSLNNQYTVIGHVVEGMNIVHQIKKGSRSQNGSVSAPDMIKTAVIVE
jgi:cyclophilin family peptidyl-prolyl cis-trans isomerase